jgi:hypothetical protein
MARAVANSELSAELLGRVAEGLTEGDPSS